MNKVTLEQWYAQPIHCPFCGSAVDDEGTGACDHWLYTLYGSFLDISDRLGAFLEITDSGVTGGELPDELKAQYGSNYKVVDAVRPKFFNLVEFDLPTPSDGTIFGFAPLKRELVNWENNHASVYDAKH